MRPHLSSHGPSVMPLALQSCVLGVCAGLLAPLAAGGSAIIPAGGKFSAGTHWRDAVDHQATYYTAVPTMHQVCHPCHVFHISHGRPCIAQILQAIMLQHIMLD